MREVWFLGKLAQTLGLKTGQVIWEWDWRWGRLKSLEWGWGKPDNEVLKVEAEQ